MFEALVMDRCHKYAAKNYPTRPLLVIGREENEIRKYFQYNFDTKKIETDKGYIGQFMGFKFKVGNFDYGFYIEKEE